MSALSTHRHPAHPWHLFSPATRAAARRTVRAEQAGEAHRDAAHALALALHWHQAAWVFGEDTVPTRAAVLRAVGVLREARGVLERAWDHCDLEDLG